MKIIRSLLFFLGTRLTMTSVNAKDVTFISAFASLDVFDELRPSLGASLYPTLTETFNTAFAESDAFNKPLNQDLGEFSSRGTAAINGISIPSKFEDRFVDIQPEGLGPGRVLVTLIFQNIQPNVDDFSVDIIFTSPTSGDFVCDFEYILDLSPAEFSIGVELFDDGSTFFFQGVTSDTVAPKLGISVVNNDPNPACPILAGQAFETVAAELEATFAELLGGFVGDFMLTIDSATDYAAPVDLNVTNGTNLILEPFLSKFEAVDNTLEVSGGTSISVELTEPEHRNGFSYNPDFQKGLPVVAPSDTKLVSLKAGADGLSKVIQASWYTLWSTLAVDPSAITSPLCNGQDSENDPCPFPPIKIKAGALDTLIPGIGGWWDAILLHLIFPLDGFFIGGFNYNIVVPPPTVKFDVSKTIITAPASIAVTGNTLFRGEVLLTSFDVIVDADATLPNYDGLTGQISGLSIKGIDFTKADLNFSWWNNLWLFWVFFKGTILDMIDGIVQGQTGTVNGLINTQLSNIAFKVPDINLVGSESGVSISLVSNQFTGVPRVGELSSYIDMEADIQASTSPIRRQLEEERVVTVYDTAAYKWALEQTEASEKLLAVALRNSIDKTTEHLKLRAGKGSDVEILKDGEWVLLPPPLSASE